VKAAACGAVLAALLAAGCGGDGDHPTVGASKPTAATTTTTTAPDTGRSDDPADDVPPPPLTLRQAIGQHMVFAYSGARPPAALKRRIARGEAAGVILFARNIRSVEHLHRQMTALQRIKRSVSPELPLLIMVDQEGGAVRRIQGPPAHDAAGTPSARAAFRNGSAAGNLLRHAGVNVDLAPVVDVARPGSALEAERRTYGRDVATVTKRSGWFAGGLRATGVNPVYKHFPGFGAATGNTDNGEVRIDLPLSELRAVDEQPYAREDPEAVMLSTAIYPRVDPRPAAFSKRWVTDELRGRLKFGGVALTDDLQAPAVAQYGAPAQLAFFALRAGVDLPLFAKDYKTGARAAEGLERAVRSGALKRADLDAGVRRVKAWRLQIVTGP
jgi:beta-N-acetylhexosaminidase